MTPVRALSMKMFQRPTLLPTAPAASIKVAPLPFNPKGDDGEPTLSRLLSNVALAADTSFVALKALPVDLPDKEVQELARPASCRQVVDAVIQAIEEACKDTGTGYNANFVMVGDIVRSVIRCTFQSTSDTETLVAWRRRKDLRHYIQRWNMGSSAFCGWEVDWDGPTPRST